MAAKDVNPDLSALQADAEEFAEDLSRVLRKARKLEAAICDAADAGSDVADAARGHVNMMVGHINIAKGHASEAHRQIPDITVAFGGGK